MRQQPQRHVLQGSEAQAIEGFDVTSSLIIAPGFGADRKSTRLNSSHANISYAVFCLTKYIMPSSLPTPTPTSLITARPRSTLTSPAASPAVTPPASAPSPLSTSLPRSLLLSLPRRSP